MHIVIIGNGISGVTAARYIRKLSDHRITIISAETDHFWSRTALMYIYMGHMRFEDTKPYEDWFWEKNRLELKKGFVNEVNTSAKQVKFEDGGVLEYDKLIIACGSKYNKFGWPGQDLDGVHGMVSYQDLQAIERHSNNLNRAVIVGGGLIGIEMAEMFHSRHIPVTFLVRENSFWDMVLPTEESAMLNKHFLKQGIDLRLQTELKEIIDDGNGKVGGLITGNGEEIDCGFVGLTAGVRPNIGFLEGSGIETERGILVDEHLQTNMSDIYAVGDCAQHRKPKPNRRPIEAIWYTGRMAGETVAYNICGKNIDYDPGIWFNSAKFMDIEYHVYGQVAANTPDHHTALYWEHPDGEKSIRLVYDTEREVIVGFNTMGIRYRHEVCEKWLKDEAPIEEVITNLGLANFDPEFYREYEQEMVEFYNQKSGKNLSIKRKRGLSAVLGFLQS